jgi:hypothetical protein
MVIAKGVMEREETGGLPLKFGRHTTCFCAVCVGLQLHRVLVDITRRIGGNGGFEMY